MTIALLKLFEGKLCSVCIQKERWREKEGGQSKGQTMLQLYSLLLLLLHVLLLQCIGRCQSLKGHGHETVEDISRYSPTPGELGDGSCKVQKKKLKAPWEMFLKRLKGTT